MTRHWYRISVSDGLGTVDRYGTSDLAPEALVQHVSAGKFLKLSDFSYYHPSKRIIVAASSEDPISGPTLYIHPAHVVMIHPLTAHPRRDATTAL